MTTANEPKLAKTLMKNYDRPASLDNPRSPHRPKSGDFEKYAWIFMRLSGIALLVLTFGHVFIMLALDSRGVHRIDASFVAARWKEPFWQCWDLLMLWLAQLHGGNGVRVIIDDYAKKDQTRFWLKTLLAISMILIVGLGSYALLTFDTTSVA
ncbi:succinate dehydrogenase hydrophobic membrane anchor subunit [Tsukamurella sp. 8F]|uniref:succinate dehydrogenase hydrophobic membrane anchor subunit n=1 Tax=unclassified Tsukamurella TaxID=2633480 RepID=UPI0023B8E530|nr:MULTISPECIES: succinate dehydrogenase hydrophobic membrane anchor subunit [unclassified Tsukamurella]MDF0531848.1 succinate dehydrogenase hydrophobic membrane anchor subunit [Tsukamurella sp. 8J]MDF0589074.1 succinate dehydrogenase hydrophobic membrane anchor subunit [Tsukamurella sp. 8F]